MKKILVISDNEVLVRHVKEVVAAESIFELAQFSYCFSAVNKNPANLIDLGMESVDLRKADVCNQILDSYQLVLSLHCKQIFPACLVKNVTCINFHPGLNPYNRGWYPQVFSIINKKPIGVTIHIMDELVDHGPVIAQEEVRIENYETSFDVYKKVLELEKRMIAKQLKHIIEGRFEVGILDRDGNYNSVQDFNALCRLDLDSVGSLRQHVDLLRALTHGDFKNAFFMDGDKKVYVRIDLVPDL